MDSALLTTVLMLGMLAAVLAIVLYFVAQKFKVEEDPRVDLAESLLPGANCGGCGFTGCRAFADALVQADDISSLFCPVGGNDIMAVVAESLGKVAEAKEPMVAVVRCSGSCEQRDRVNLFDGASSCAIMASTYSGDTNCSYGCLGQGDCVTVCNFGAIEINPETLLPEVVEEKCTACGACVTACPKFIIELRKKGPKSRRIFVSCVNKDKGGIARKACKVSCIGCSACFKACAFEAITMESFLAYIDPNKCKLCRKCVEVCPRDSIHELNFPPRKPKVEKPKVEKPKVAEAKPAAVAEKPKVAEVKQEVVAEKPKEVETKQEVVAEKPKVAEVKQEVVAEKPKEVETKQEVVAEKPKVAEVKQEVVAEKPKEVETKQEVVAEKPQVVEAKQEAMAETITK